MERFVEILRGKSISGSGDTDHLWIDWKRKRGGNNQSHDSCDYMVIIE